MRCIYIYINKFTILKLFFPLRVFRVFAKLVFLSSPSLRPKPFWEGLCDGATKRIRTRRLLMWGGPLLKGWMMGDGARWAPSRSLLNGVITNPYC